MAANTTPTNRYPTAETDGEGNYNFRHAIDVAARKVARNGGRYAVSMTSAGCGRFYTVSKVAAQ